MWKNERSNLFSAKELYSAIFHIFSWCTLITRLQHSVLLELSAITGLQVMNSTCEREEMLISVPVPDKITHMKLRF